MSIRFLRAALTLAAFSSTGLLRAQCVETFPLTGTYIPFGDATGSGNGPFTLTATNSTFSGVEFVPNQTFTFAQLTSLFATFTSNSGGSGGGTPRFVVGVNVGGTETFIDIDLGNSPNFTDSDAVLNTYSGFNVIGNNDAGRYQTGPGAGGFAVGGSPFTTYSGSPSSALTLAGPFQVEEIDYVTDTFGTFPSRNETLFSIGGSIALPCPPDAFQVGYAANVGPNGGGGESFVNITNNGASATSPATGNLCVNIYAFDPTEEMLSCCACEVSPNGLATLGVNSSLLTNTLTSEHPGSAVIKLLASAGTGTGCDPTSPGTSANPLAPGLRAWSTIQHATTNPTTVGLTEIPFSMSDLSAQELNHVTAYCGFILSLLPTGGTSSSGFGICKGCTTGGQ